MVISEEPEMTMNHEILELIEAVRTSPRPVQEVVHDFAYWTRPVSGKWTHLAWVTGGAAV
jgi:hypothetical protein